MGWTQGLDLSSAAMTTSADTTTTAGAGLALWKALALGVFGGVMAGLFGVGGGIVLVPGLVLMARLPQHNANATSLVAILVTAPAALIPSASDGEVSYVAAGALAVGALVGVFGGAAAMARIPARILRLIFGVFMLVVAVRLFLPGGGDGGADGVQAALGVGVILGLGVTGLATGLLSALLGVGGGIVLVPAMVLLFGFSQHLSQGTSLAVIIPTALVGAVRHSRHGYTLWRTGFTVGAGGLVGGFAGGTLAQLLPGDALQVAFAVLLVVAGVRMISTGREPDNSRCVGG